MSAKTKTRSTPRRVAGRGNPKTAVADIPENVGLVEVLADMRHGFVDLQAEVRRGFADVVYAIGKNGKGIADVDARMEGVRKVLFFIPDVARGVELSKERRAAKLAAAKVATDNSGAATVTPSAESSAGAGAAHAGVVNVAALPQLIAPESESGVKA